MKTRLINTDALKREIAETLSISDIASEILGIELHEAGNQHKGLCPIHAEDTPSFHLDDNKGVYHCFGCKAGGDWIDLIQRVRHLEYFETLYFAAEQAGIDISQYERPLTDQERADQKIRDRAEMWLAGLPVPTDRGDPEVLEKFGVRVGDGDIDLPGVERYHKEHIIFPMRTASGHLVGWRARHPDKKYFATPKGFALHETTFFGLPQAREHIRKDGTVIIVEGEYDVMACHAAGIQNAVSIGGSAFTDEHMEVLRRLKVRKAVFLLDGDTGGKTAAKSIAERWWQGDVRCFIGILPEGKDPDDLVQEGAGNFLQIVIGQARWALEYTLHEKWSEYPMTMSSKMEFLDWVAQKYGQVLKPAEELIVADFVASLVGLPDAKALDFVRTEHNDLVDAEAEAVVIGKCLRSAKYYNSLRAKLVRTDFYLVRNQRIWQVLEDMMIENLEFDPVLIRQRSISAGVDEDHFKTLVDSGDQNIAYYEDRISDLAIRREAKEEADRFRDRITDLTLDSKDTIGNLTLGVTRKTLNGHQGFATISDQVDKAMEQLQERMKNPDAVHGIDLGTQFPILNQKLQGVQKKRLVLVAATSGVGKTTITIQWAINMAVVQAIPTDYISLEMDDDELLYKACSHLTGINAERITAGRLEGDEIKLIEKAMMRIKKSPLHLYAPDTITPSEFVLYARESVMERRTEVFYLDYIQMASPDPGMERKQTYEQLKEFGRVAKTQVARAMDVSVICPAQLSRASDEKERPTKEDMGDSYDLSRTADVVIILKKVEDTDNIDMWLDKNRQGSGGHLIPVTFSMADQTLHEQGGFKEPDYRLSA